MEKDKIEKFEKLHIQIKDMYNELSILSKKSPDCPVLLFEAQSGFLHKSESDILVVLHFHSFHHKIQIHIFYSG